MTGVMDHEPIPPKPGEMEFLDHVSLMVGYWAGEGQSNVPKDMPCVERLEGVAFSILVALDGGAAVGPYALQSIDGLGNLGEDIAGALHERFIRRKPGDTEPT